MGRVICLMRSCWQATPATIRSPASRVALAQWRMAQASVRELGRFAFTVTATDGAGNATSRTTNYSIATPGYSFGGFFSPIDNSPIVNTVKAGRAVPVKWSLRNGNGGYVSDPATFRSLTSQAISCSRGAPSDAIEESMASGSSGLQYDSPPISSSTTGDGSGWKGTCRQLVLKLSDGQRSTRVFDSNKLAGRKDEGSVVQVQVS